MSISDLGSIMKLIDLMVKYGLLDAADAAEIKNKLVDRVTRSMK